MSAPSSYTQSWGESIENQITTFNAQLNDIDSRLRAINSCQCNEEQIRAAINVMNQKVSELSTAVQEVQANLKHLKTASSAQLYICADLANRKAVAYHTHRANNICPPFPRGALFCLF